LGTILNLALDKTLQAMGIEAGGIYLLDEDSGMLYLAVQRGFNPQASPEIDRLRVGEGFSGRVVESGEPLVVDDASADPRLTKTVVRKEGLRSLAVAPLNSRGKVLGTIFAITHDHREFTDQDVQLLTSIGNQIGVAVENARLYEDTRNRLAQVVALQETTTAVASTLELDELLTLITQQATTLLQADAGILNLVDWDKNEDEVVAAAGLATFMIGSRDSLTDTLSGWVALHNQPVISNQIQEDDRTSERALEWFVEETQRKVQSAAAAPLSAKGQVMGTLVIIDKLGGTIEFDQVDLDLLVAFANQAATAIENARLYEQAQQSAIIEERGRLARELHDSVTQSLYSLTLLAEAGQRLAKAGDIERAREYMHRLGEIGQQSLKEMRLLVYELRPLALREEGLVGALNQRLDAVERRAGVDARLIVEGEFTVSEQAEEALYRIAQEALNNALKHAAPTLVEVTIRADGKRVELEVADDGRGFDLDAAGSGGGMGLVSMQERAERIGATYQVISAAGEGTRVKVCLACNHLEKMEVVQ
jgi:signal transduction histidine kinase